MCPRQRHLIYQASGDFLRIIRANCKQWDCDECRKFNKRKLASLIVGGQATKFLTLTLKPKENEYPREHRKRLEKCRRTLFKRIERKKKLAHLPYLWIVEAHQSGFAHLHVLIRYDYVPNKWLRKTWRYITKGSWRADIRRVKSKRGIAKYLLKYLVKAPAKFGTSRHWGMSKDWTVEKRSRRPQEAWSETRVLLHCELVTLRTIISAAGWVIYFDNGNSLEAIDSVGARAPPMWEQTKEISELGRKRAAAREAAA